ncbi:ATP-binding protein [Streptomyces sp. NPDC058773]|uniref:ATP-binding protein n=1 Tax=Streptomyces sp. NPDC058773 TaxID=3346632 RepID=UPI0036C6F32C
METHPALIPPAPETDTQRRRRQPREAPGRSADAALSGNHTTCRLAHRPESVGQARRIVGSLLHRWQVTEEAATSVLLVVSELVTNAVEHAQPPLALHVLRERTGRRVWVGITDGGPSTRKGAWTASCTPEEHGRGLDIVDTLATAHGTRSHEAGATHWARLPAADQVA